MKEQSKQETIENSKSTEDIHILENNAESKLSKVSMSEEMPEPAENIENDEALESSDCADAFENSNEAETSSEEKLNNKKGDSKNLEYPEENNEDETVLFIEEESFNVYDFDKTLLPYDSTVAFFIFCLKRQLGLLSSIIPAALAFPLYMLGIITKTRIKEIFYQHFLKKLEDVDELVKLYWQVKKRDFYPWYLSQKKSSDLVISASPDFLLRPICEELGVRLIASRVDRHTGKTEGLNNYGMEKLVRFREEFPLAVIEEFYSDSLSDEPLAMIAKKAFLIKRDRPVPWPEHR